MKPRSPSGRSALVSLVSRGSVAIARGAASSPARIAARSVSAPSTRILPCAGVPAGATTRASPSFAHSSSRRSAWAAGRRRPVRPISPKAAVAARTGRRRAAEAIASATARSAPGSSMRTPPATLTKTSACPSGIPAWRASTATIIASRFGSTPVATRLRHRQVGLRDERLDLEQDRPRPLERARDGRARLALDGAAEDLRRIGDADEPAAGHLEDAELVRRAEPVLRRAQDAVGVVAVALELEHAVDEVLEHARPGHRAVLRDVADEDRGDAGLLRDAQQPCGRLAHLRDRARRRAELRRVQRLHGVDHADVGPLAAQRLADDLELRLGEHLDAPGTAEPLGAQLDLRDRLLAR